jgi:hypothetical protein
MRVQLLPIAAFAAGPLWAVWCSGWMGGIVAVLTVAAVVMLLAGLLILLRVSVSAPTLSASPAFHI